MNQLVLVSVYLGGYAWQESDVANIEKTLSLLSIGHRGVGKTVFLAASYVELEKELPSKRWFGFDFDDELSRRNIGSLLASIEQTGAYPPPTPTVSDFTLRLNLGPPPIALGTLCRFRWQDIPGELCVQWNQQFRNIVMAAHGCCLFFDASVLADAEDYLEMYSGIVEQAMAIAVLVRNNRMVMPFMVVLTKYDLLANKTGAQSRMQGRLDELIGSLVALVPSCRILCCQAPIEHLGDRYQLRPSGCAEALIWIMQKTWQAHVGAWPLQWAGVLRALGPQSTRETNSLAPGLLEQLLGGQEVPHSTEEKPSNRYRNDQ